MENSAGFSILTGPVASAHVDISRKSPVDEIIDIATGTRSVPVDDDVPTEQRLDNEI